MRRVDASALVAAAAQRPTIIETIQTGRLVLDRQASLAAQRFVRALGELQRVFRTQGVTLREIVATIAHAFSFEGAPGGVKETLSALEAEASTFDAAHGDGWTIDAALEALEDTVAPSFHSAPSTTLASRAPLRMTGSLQPLPVHVPEEPRVVSRRRTHYSASSLGTYAECERRWFYRYVCAAIEDKGSSASFYGSAFHWALERFHQEFRRGDMASPEAMAAKLDGWIQTAFDRFRSGFETRVEYELQLRRARRTAGRYLTWFIERSRAHPFAVIGTETEVHLLLDGYEFIGYIDRLDRDDATGALTVVDYKTGSIATSASEYRDSVAQFVDFQLPFYYWAETAQGERVSRLALVPLRDALLEVAPIELEVVPVAVPPSRNGNGTTGTIGIDELERARAKMIELARRLADEPLERFEVTRDADVCTYCAYRPACRLHPHAHEDRFAR